MAELEDAIELANYVLDSHTRDPDETECVLARQLIRLHERLLLLGLDLYTRDPDETECVLARQLIRQHERLLLLGLDLSPIKSRDFVSSEEL